MLRFVILLIGILFAIRLFLSLIIKAAVALFGASQQRPSASPSNAPIPIGGELVRDPVCGTYVSQNTSMKKSIAGTTHYFCSQDCKDKFHG